MRWPRWGGTDPKPYRLKDLLSREQYRNDYVRIAEHLLESLDFDSAFDVGCANGFLLQPLAAAGKQVAGVDLSPDVKTVLPPDLVDRVRVGDFVEASDRWDLVCCVEVAEHVAPDRSIELVDVLARLASRWILFSAAPPGQPGRGHINCRPLSEWLGWMRERGWSLHPTQCDRLERTLSSLDDVPWLRDNCVLLSRNGSNGRPES